MYSDVENWIKDKAVELEKLWGISHKYSDRFATFVLYLQYYGLNPIITSGWRSAAKQRDLYNRWLAGDRSVVTPAKPGTSRHEKTGMFGRPASEAIDIQTSNQDLAARIAAALGIRPGLWWRNPDWPHFEAV